MVYPVFSGIQLLFRPSFQAPWVPLQEWSRSSTCWASVSAVFRCQGSRVDPPPAEPLVFWFQTLEPLGKRSSEVSP